MQRICHLNVQSLASKINESRIFCETHTPGGRGGTPILDLTGMLVVTFRG